MLTIGKTKSSERMLKWSEILQWYLRSYSFRKKLDPIYRARFIERGRVLREGFRDRPLVPGMGGSRAQPIGRLHLERIDYTVQQRESGRWGWKGRNNNWPGDEEEMLYRDLESFGRWSGKRVLSRKLHNIFFSSTLCETSNVLSLCGVWIAKGQSLQLLVTYFIQKRSYQLTAWRPIWLIYELINNYY